MATTSNLVPQRPASAIAFPGSGEVQLRWYALHTRARHEKKIALELHQAGIEIFLPLVAEVHRWSDRCKKVQMPLFPCYLFIRTSLLPRNRSVVLLTAGVIGFVGTNGGSSIEEREIESVRTVIASKIPFSRSILRKGQRVRVRGGVLNGVEGLLTSDPNERRLVIAVGEVRQSLSISVEGYELEAA